MGGVFFGNGMKIFIEGVLLVTYASFLLGVGRPPLFFLSSIIIMLQDSWLSFWPRDSCVSGSYLVWPITGSF